MIERKTDNNGDRLQFLIQYTKGQAQRLVKSCEYMAPDRGSHPSKATSSSYVIGVALPSKELKLQTSCTFCSSKHTLDKCKAFAKKAHKDKLSLLKANGICFGCLQATSHISKDCKQRLTCSICKQVHPNTLHIERKASQEAEKPFDVIGNTSTELCGHIEAGDQDSVLPIVPIKVKAAKGSHVLQVYALLDPGSSATFCSEELMSRLHMKVLLQGPDLTNSLIGVILRFRKEPIGIMADVKSMFHQVRVSDFTSTSPLLFTWCGVGDCKSAARFPHLCHRGHRLQFLHAGSSVQQGHTHT
ncbi:hypothetical protein SRHO_G00208740 [Serrasalmus rhombeus]